MTNKMRNNITIKITVLSAIKTTSLPSCILRKLKNGDGGKVA